MTQENTFNLIGQYYRIFKSISIVFEKEANKNATFEASGVAEYERILHDAEKELPGLLKSFNKNDYFSHDNSAWGQGAGNAYYKHEGIRMHLGRNLAILESKLAEQTNDIGVEQNEFYFIEDQGIRKILSRDFLEIQRNIIIQNWKSTIILCGGSIEAILLNLLSNNSLKAKESENAPKKELNEWDLNNLIDVSVDIKLVGSEIAKLSHSIREYRNMIHPGVEIRKNLKVEQEEAQIAFQVLKILIRELS